MKYKCIFSKKDGNSYKLSKVSHTQFFTLKTQYETVSSETGARTNTIQQRYNF